MKPNTGVRRPGLPYQVATHEPEEEEDYHNKNGTQATTMAWSALVAMLGTLALAIGGGKKIICLLTTLLFFLGNGGLHSQSAIYWEHQVRINTRSDTLLYSSQHWMKAVAKPHYLKHVQVRVRDEEDVHNVDVPEVPPDPGSSPQPWMKMLPSPAT